MAVQMTAAGRFCNSRDGSRDGSKSTLKLNYAVTKFLSEKCHSVTTMSKIMKIVT
jgi:hypothetical protein